MVLTTVLVIGTGIFYLIVRAAGQNFVVDTFYTNNPESNPEYYIASKTNLVVTGGQVKLNQDCSSYGGCAELNGSGVCVAKAAGEYSLPACKKCDGVSLYPVNFSDNTQDTTSPNTCSAACVKCSGGSCVNQSSSEDLFAHCGTTECYTGNCNGSGSCGYYVSGERNCSVCKTCNGATSGSCVTMANNTQDAEGSNLCNQTCKKCSNGSCAIQSSSEDLFNQCETTGCLTGNCKGGTAECGYYSDGAKHNCSICYYCNASGNCTALTADGVFATFLGCTAGQEACRRCDAGVCTYYTSGQHGCPAGQECNASGQCAVVVACRGIEWGGYCWYEGVVGQTCTTVCATHGGNVGTCQENDNTTCSLCRTFHPGAPGCASSTRSCTPAYTSSNGQCYRRGGVVGNCDAIWASYLRFCACNN